MRTTSVQRRLSAATLAAALITSFAIPIFSPFFIGTASAAPTVINTVQGWDLHGQSDLRSPGADTTALQPVRCVGHMESVYLGGAEISRALFGDNGPSDEEMLNEMQSAYDAFLQDPNGYTVESIAKNRFGNDPNSVSYYKYLAQNMQTTVPAVKLYQPDNAAGATCGGLPGTNQPRFVLIPVAGTSTDPTKWMGVQITGWTRDYEKRFLIFENPQSSGEGTTGFLTYYQSSAGVLDPKRENITLGGVAEPPPDIVINIPTGTFIDASTIKLAWTVDGHDVVEYYRDYRWDMFSFYFLDRTEGHPDPGRANLTFSQQSKAADADPLCDPGYHGTPFIWLPSGANQADDRSWVSSTDRGVCDNGARELITLHYDRADRPNDFNNRLHGLGEQFTIGSTTRLPRWFDYLPGGTPPASLREQVQELNHLPRGIDVQTLTNSNTNRDWFFLTNEDGVITASPVWTAGDATENGFVGLYTYNATSNRLEHALTGEGACSVNSTLALSLPAGQTIESLQPGNTVDASWDLLKGGGESAGCAEAFQNDAEVRVQVVSAEEFVDAQPPPATTEETPPDPCTEGAGVFGWIICPSTSLFQDIAVIIDGWIMFLIRIDSATIFDSGATDSYFRVVWILFRNIAYALLVILGLIMVVSQIAGLDLFDAYAIRKMLPKIVAATVIIPLLWPALEIVTDMANESSLAIEQIIKGPFVEISQTSPIVDWIATITIASGGVLGAGAFIAIGGWGVFLALLGSLILTAGQALAVIAARNIVFYILVVASPVAVVLAIFEPFKKGFDLWRRLLTGILLSIPAVAAVLAASRVGAMIGRETELPGLGIVFELAFIVTGYLMFWPILKSMDKVAGQIDGMLDKVTSGAQKALSKYRGDTMKRRFAEGKEGRKFGFGRNGRFGGLANLAARTSRRLDDSGKLGGPGFFSRGKHIVAIQRGTQEAAEKMVKHDNNRNGGDDDTMEAIHRTRNYNGAHSFLTRRLMDRDSTLSEKDAQDAAHKRLQAAETTFQGKIGTDEMRTAATMALYASNTSMRVDPTIGRTADSALEDARAGLQDMQAEGVIDNTQAAAIFTSNKGRERAMAGFAAGMKFVAQGSQLEVGAFLRDAIKGSGPGGLAGQRWETLVAVSPHMREMLRDVDATMHPQYEQLVDQGMVSGLTEEQAVVQARTQIATQHATDFQTTYQAEMTRLQTDPGLQAGFERVVAEAKGRGLDSQQAAQQAQQWWNDQAHAQAQQAGMVKVLGGMTPEQLDTAIERFAMLDAVYKVTGQISRQSAEPLKKEATSQSYSFGGMTMTGEQWLRTLESSSVPPEVARKFREARFSYGAQAEGARQAGAVVGGGPVGAPPQLVP